jgi:hypothetical protein
VHGRVEIRSTIQAQIEDLVANAKAAPENSEVDDKLTAEGSGNNSRHSARSGACRTGSHKPHPRYDVDQGAGPMGSAKSSENSHDIWLKAGLARH